MLRENYQGAMVGRLMRIISRKTVIVQTKNGPVEDEVAADKNAIATAKLLLTLHAQWLKHRPAGTGTAGSSASDDGFRIGKSLARCEMLSGNDQEAIVDRLMQIVSKEFVIVKSKNGPVEDEAIADKNAIAAAKLLVAMQALWLKYPGTGTAGSCASDDGFKIGKSLACCETDNEADTADAGDRSGSEDGFRTERSFSRGEPNETPAEASYTAQDVVREALRLAVARANQDEPSRDVVIERIRGNLHEAHV